MKKVVLAASIALLSITAACQPSPKPKVEKKFHVVKHKVYHFKDGRVGYHDDDFPLIWYWLIFSQPNASTASSPSSIYPNGSAASYGATPTIAGGWAKGAAPKAEDEEEATVEEQGVIETETGEPVSVAEAEAVEAADPGIAETAVDAEGASGAVAGTVSITAEAEGESGGSTPGEGAGAGEGAGGGDAGGGGGGDAGGGGGDGGGGGGGGD